jgi:hypothetical protein
MAGSRRRRRLNCHAVLALTAALAVGASALARADGEGPGTARPRSAFARNLPLIFDSEHIALSILGDSLEVRGRYLLRCQGRGEGEIPLLYPFPRDSLLGGWRFLSLDVRAGLAGDALPARWEAVPHTAAVRWWLPPCPGDTLVAEAVYRQALRGEYARYIVTTTRAWERPLRRAEFEIRLPAGAEPLEFSFPFAPAAEAPGLYRYEAADFLPDHDITVRWRAAAVEIPFRLQHGKVILPVRVGDSRELRIILDTGMTFDGLLITNGALADSLPLAGAVAAQLGGAGSGAAQSALMVEGADFRAGALEFTGQRLVVLQSDAMRGFANDGVCGQSLFGHYAVKLDYARSVIVLHEPGAFSPDSSWTALPLSFKAHGVPWLEVAVSISGADSVLLAAYLDLAASETLELLTGESQRFALPAGREAVYLGRGLGGDIHGERGQIAWVQLGPLRVEQVKAAFVPAALRSKQPGAEAVVGGGLLCRFHCVFDYAGAQLFLKPPD